MARNSQIASIKALIGKIMKPIASTLVSTYATKSELSDLEDELGSSVIVDVPVHIDENDDEMLVIEDSAEAYIDDEILVFGEEDVVTT